MINEFIDALHTTSLHTGFHLIQLTFYRYILYNSHFKDTSYTTKLHELANFC
ncbi:hypothetical protein HanRHA438_Chr12g0557951 [Helianthus annuus]|nr:hypothetical protein HanRHA438_Chr12g0557951 [Helianthus annuus]